MKKYSLYFFGKLEAVDQKSKLLKKLVQPPIGRKREGGMYVWCAELKRGRKVEHNVALENIFD